MDNEQLEKAMAEIKLYLQCQASYYDHCAKASGHQPDAIRAQMCLMIIQDIEQKGRMKLTIDRLKQFLPS